MPLVPQFLAGRAPVDLYHQYLMPTFEPWVTYMLERVPPSGRVLDIACGTGLVSRLVAASGDVSSIEAIDVAEPMIAKAHALGGDPEGKIRYSIASALELPFDDDSFDVAYCHQGLQFFPDRPLAMREAKRVLRSGAKTIYSTWCFARDGLPVFAALEEIAAEEFGSDLVPFGPFAFGDREAIGALAEQAGFEIETLATEQIGSPLPDVRTFILFDICHLGRPAFDGKLQPVLDFEDPANDVVIERIIARMEEATEDYRQDDGSILAPMSSNILVARA